MAQSIAKRTEAKKLYLEGENTKEIEKVTGISKSTLDKWKAAENWDSEVTVYSTLQLANDMQTEFRKEVYKAMKEGKLTDSKTADALNKVAGIMDRLIPEKVLLANLMRMLKDETEFFQRFGPKGFVH